METRLDVARRNIMRYQRVIDRARLIGEDAPQSRVMIDQWLDYLAEGDPNERAAKL